MASFSLWTVLKSSLISLCKRKHTGIPPDYLVSTNKDKVCETRLLLLTDQAVGSDVFPLTSRGTTPKLRTKPCWAAPPCGGPVRGNEQIFTLVGEPIKQWNTPSLPVKWDNAINPQPTTALPNLGRRALWSECCIAGNYFYHFEPWITPHHFSLDQNLCVSWWIS